MAYLFGVWKFRGWWYYYLAAAIVKVPLGVWILLVLAIAARLAGLRFGPSWRDELILLAPAVATLIFISSQTGINRHFRYALPTFPFLYVWLSSLAIVVRHSVVELIVARHSVAEPPRRTTVGRHSVAEPPRRSRGLHSPILRLLPAILATAAFAWAIVSSLLVYPHSLSYFNEFAGGPRGGHRFLLDSNTDWGQDLLLIKRWIDDHPEARPVYIAWPHDYLRPDHAEIDASGVPSTSSPGWQILSVNSLNSNNNRFRDFRDRTPAAFVGGSTAIFHIPPPPELLPAELQPHVNLPD
jgi:hypothetical protein